MIQPERKHEWVSPPPGAGRHKVCKHCGHRLATAPADCPEPTASMARNLHEYDPLDIEGDPR